MADVPAGDRRSARPYTASGPHDAAPARLFAAGWRALARCADVDPEVMFPAPTDAIAVETARALCAACPVATACLTDVTAEEYGRGLDSRWGIRGGLTPEERLERATAAGEPVTKRPRGRKPLSPCGSVAAYDRHRKRGETICDACREAHRMHQRAKAAERRARKAEAAA